MKKYTDEHFEFIKENVSGRSQKEITAMFNDRFGMELSVGQMRSYLKNHQLKSNSKFTYPDEQIEFIAKNIEGRSHRDMAIMFNEHFGTNFPDSIIMSLAFRNGLKNGRDCHFNKGHEPTQFKKGLTPWNKGMKGVNFGGKQTQFKKGQKGWNYKPVGTERINGDGYMDIKIAEPGKWKGKHILIWEAKHGPVPKGHCLVFADRNPLNVTLENLLLVSRRELAIMNKRGLISGDPELTKTGVVIAGIYLKIGERKRK